jgi:hypothetical protein
MGSEHGRCNAARSRSRGNKLEPDPQYACETSRGFEQLVYRALAEDKISESKAAELLGLPLAEFVAQRNMEAPPASRRSGEDRY